MTKHARGRRHYRKSQDRRVRVFSEINLNLRPEQIAKVITSAGLEQARRETEAQAADAARSSTATGEEVDDE